jgi:hypothetical protein
MSTMLLAGCIATLLVTTAIAQPAPPPGGPRAPGPSLASPSPPAPDHVEPDRDGSAPPPPRGRRDGPPPPPAKGAHFRLEQGGFGVDVKCADDEPMRACADITLQLLDRAMTASSSPASSVAAPAPSVGR